MIRAQIPQDVTDYKEEFFFGLTLRKLIAVIATIAIVAPLYVIGKKFVDTSILIYVAAILCTPIILVGFKDIDGMPFEKYAELIWTFFTKEQRRKFIYFPTQEKSSAEINTILLAGEKILRKDEIQKLRKQERLSKKNKNCAEKKSKKERKRKKNAE